MRRSEDLGLGANDTDTIVCGLHETNLSANIVSCSGTKPVGLETGPLDSTASCVQNRRQVKVT